MDLPSPYTDPAADRPRGLRFAPHVGAVAAGVGLAGAVFVSAWWATGSAEGVLMLVTLCMALAVVVAISPAWAAGGEL